MKFALGRHYDQGIKSFRSPEEQIIGILKEHVTGVSVVDLCRTHNVNDVGIYKLKAKVGGMEVSDAKQLRALKGGSAILKRMLAAATLENVAPMDLIGMQW